MANALYIQRILDVRQMIGVAWTLCIEVQFYALMLVLTSILKSDKKRHFALMAIVGATILIHYATGLFGDGNFVFQFLPWFIVGILTSRLSEQGVLHTLGIISVVTLSQSLLEWADYRDIICTLVYGCIAHLAIRKGKTDRANKTIAKISVFGAYTYSIYLTHMLAIKAISMFNTNSATQIISSFMLCAVMAYLLNRFVEVPALALSRRFSYGK